MLSLTTTNCTLLTYSVCIISMSIHWTWNLTLEGPGKSWNLRCQNVYELCIHFLIAKGSISYQTISVQQTAQNPPNINTVQSLIAGISELRSVPKILPDFMVPNIHPYHRMPINGHSSSAYYSQHV